MANVVKRLFDYYANCGSAWNWFALSGHCKCFGVISEEQSDGKWEDVLWRSRGVPYNKTQDEQRATTEDMRELVRIWRAAGWSVSRGRDDKWGYIQYKFTKEPYTDYGYKVVNDFIDTI